MNIVTKINPVLRKERGDNREIGIVYRTYNEKSTKISKLYRETKLRALIKTSWFLIDNS